MELFEQRVQNIGFFILFDLFIRFYLTKFSACLVFKAVAMMRMMMMTMMVRMMVMAVMRQAESVTQKLLFFAVWLLLSCHQPGCGFYSRGY